MLDVITPRDVDGYCDECGATLRWDFDGDDQLCHKCSGGRTPDETLLHDDPECACSPFECRLCKRAVSWCMSFPGDSTVCADCGLEEERDEEADDMRVRDEERVRVYED